MNLVYAVSACVAIAATVMVITRRNAVHALLYLVVSLLAVAVIMFLLGAAFVAALEVIIYAGAIMVLFVFVIMLIGPRNDTVNPRTWMGPVILGLILLAELVYVITAGRPGCAGGEGSHSPPGGNVSPRSLSHWRRSDGVSPSCRACRRIPPGAPPCRVAGEKGGLDGIRSLRIRPCGCRGALPSGARRLARAAQPALHPVVRGNHAQRRGTRVHRGRRPLGPG